MRFQAFLLILVLAVSFWLAKSWQDKAEGEIFQPEPLRQDSWREEQAVLADKISRIIPAEPVVLQKNSGEIFSSGGAIATSSETFTCGKDSKVQAAKLEYLDRDKIGFSLNSKKRWPMASLTKLLAAAVVLENIDPTEKIIITEKAAAAEGRAGDFKAGEIFTSADLVAAALLVSSNDAISALAGYLGDEKFLELIRLKIKDIGLADTSVFEPTGLSARNQSTPDDIVKLASHFYRYRPEILEITRRGKSQITELNSGRKRVIYNINQFAEEPDFLGGKTGYIDEARGNLISIFNIRSQPVAVVVFGADDRFEETRKLLKCI